MITFQSPQCEHQLSFHTKFRQDNKRRAGLLLLYASFCRGYGFMEEASLFSHSSVLCGVYSHVVISGRPWDWQFKRTESTRIHGRGWWSEGCRRISLGTMQPPSMSKYSNGRLSILLTFDYKFLAVVWSLIASVKLFFIIIFGLFFYLVCKCSWLGNFEMITRDSFKHYRK